MDIEPLKFQSSLDRQIFAIEESLIDGPDPSLTDDKLQALCEDAMTLKERRDARRRRKGRIKDHKRSRMMKKAWKANRRTFMMGIKKFNKSIEGKRLHQKVARNRKAGRYRPIGESAVVFQPRLRPISEWYVNLSSMLTHLGIQTQYTSSINEEVEVELMLECANALLLPILEELSDRLGDDDGTFDVNALLDQTDAGMMIDDLIGGLKMCACEGPCDCPVYDIQKDCDCAGPCDCPTSLRVSSIAESERGDIPDEDDGADTSTVTNPLSRIAMVDPEAVGLPESQEAVGTGDPIQDALLKDDAEAWKRTCEQANEALTFDPAKIVQMICESAGGAIDVSQFEFINEAAGDADVDGQWVIAKVRGPAFFPNTVSRNKVEYSRELWDTALGRPEFRRELEARRLYGTIGHDLEINDESIRAGLFSHVLSDVWIDDADGIGKAEYLVFNTEPGRSVAMLFAAKSKLRVSTRAAGNFLTKRNANGNKVPDPKTFFLRGIDFVHDPGYLQAEPTLA